MRWPDLARNALPGWTGIAARKTIDEKSPKIVLHYTVRAVLAVSVANVLQIAHPFHQGGFSCETIYYSDGGSFCPAARF